MLKFPLSVMMSIEQSILLSLIDLYAEHYPYPLLVFPAGLCFIVNLKKKQELFTFPASLSKNNYFVLWVPLNFIEVPLFFQFWNPNNPARLD
jgi:hypothetical protein